MESLKRQNSIYPWIVVGLLWVVALLNYMDRQMLSTMKEAMQIDIAELTQSLNAAHEIHKGYIEAVYAYNISVLELELYTE